MSTNKIRIENQAETAETDTTKRLAPDGTGGVEWGTGGGSSLDVTDGSTTVTGVSVIDFTSGATVTDGGGGTAEVAVTASGSLEVKEADGTPDVSGVSLIIVSNGTLTDNGGGSVSITTGGGGGGGADVNHPMPLDAYAIDGTYGDDFTGASLSGSWTRRSLTSGEETYQVGPMGTYMRVSGATASAGYGYLRTAPSGDWTFACSFIRRSIAESSFGICVVDTNGTGVLFQSSYGAHTPWAPLLVQLTTYTSYGGSYVEPGVAGTSPNVNLWTYDTIIDRKSWWYIRKSGTDYFGAFSVDGEVWSPETPALAWAGTVDRVGMLFGPLSTGGGTYLTLDIDWFNRLA